VRYQKQKAKVARDHEKIAAQRFEFQNVLSKRMIKSHDHTFAEDLKVANMKRNHKLAKAISDVSWSQFLSLCEAKAAQHGKVFMKVPPQYTTQTCSVCGYVMSGDESLGLDVEDWICPSCGAHHFRDHNSAKNILARGEAMLAEKEKETAAASPAAA
jgi:putative transposase